MQDVPYRRANAGMAFAVGGSRKAKSVDTARARRTVNDFPLDNFLPQLGRGSFIEDALHDRVLAEGLRPAFCNRNVLSG
jgi:hypothetical protein